MNCRPATTSEEVRGAWSLLYRVYLAAGYISPNDLEAHAPAKAMGPESVVILAEGMKGIVTGTITAMVDSEVGLPLEDYFPQQMTALRNGSNLIEIGMLAEEVGHENNSVFDLMRWGFWWGVACGCTDVVCGIPPARARLYGKLMGFQQVGRSRPYGGGEEIALMCANIKTSVENNANLKAMKYFVDNPIEKSRYDGRFEFADAVIA